MTEIDLTPFCFVDSDGVSYPVLAQPFHRGLYTIASDHCILVRVPRGDGGDHDSGPDTSHLEMQIIREGLSSLPAVQLPFPKTCEKCQGGGKIIPCECAAFDDACEACSFMRGVPAYAPDENDCTCGHCLGRKVAHPIGAQVYLTPVLAIDPRYYGLLQELPGIRVDLSVDSTDEDAIRGVSFTFDGGDGTVMPLLTAPAENAPAYVAPIVRPDVYAELLPGEAF
jgi:hypothetical protein